MGFEMHFLLFLLLLLLLAIIECFSKKSQKLLAVHKINLNYELNYELNYY